MKHEPCCNCYGRGHIQTGRQVYKCDCCNETGIRPSHEIRADERRKCIAELQAYNRERTGHEWVSGSLWANMLDRCAALLGKALPH